jgi:hypothetical protein
MPTPAIWWQNQKEYSYQGCEKGLKNSPKLISHIASIIFHLKKNQHSQVFLFSF